MSSTPSTLYNVQTVKFREASKALNALEASLFAKEVLEPLASHAEITPHLKEISELVKHIVERAAQQRASLDRVIGELKNVISDEHLKALLKYYQLFVQQVLKKMEHSPVVPHHLNDVHWRLQLELANDRTEKILEPTALFQFNLSDPDGKPTEEFSLEFDHDELYRFFCDLEDMQEQLDALS